MQGAEFSLEENQIKFTESLGSILPDVSLKWVHISSVDEEAAAKTIEIPVYLNTQRSNLIMKVKIPTQDISHKIWYQRGVALFLQSDE